MISSELRSGGRDLGPCRRITGPAALWNYFYFCYDVSKKHDRGQGALSVKRVVSVSLGSSRRNHRVEVEILGQQFSIERVGTDGDLQRAVQMIRSLDGEVDAIGLGGVDLYLVAGKRRYMLRDASMMARAASVTPVVDGTGLKNTLERRTVRYLHDEGILQFDGATVLMVSALDRFGMAEALQEAGAKLILGDVVFALGIPIPLRSLSTLGGLLRVLAPVVCRLPMTMLYPTGKKQDEITPKYGRLYQEADIIAGDLHFIRRYMPDDLPGKVIITNTVTRDNVDEFRQRGVRLLVTTTPEYEGRSFGTNVLEGVLVALLGRQPEDLIGGEYEQLLDDMQLEPRVEYLNQ